MVSCEIENQTEKRPVLTDRQMEILEKFALGFSNKEIARKLGISVETVKDHFSVRQEDGRHDGIFARLGVGSRTEAVFKGIALGYLDLQQLTTETERQRCEKLPPLQEEILAYLVDPSFPFFMEQNKAVAQKFGIARRTVENHLTYVYRVLGINGKGGNYTKATRAAVIFLAYQQEQKAESSPQISWQFQTKQSHRRP